MRRLRTIALIYTGALLAGCTAPHDLPPCDGGQTDIDHVRIHATPHVFPPLTIEIRRVGRGPSARIEIDPPRALPLGFSGQLLAEHFSVLQLAQVFAQALEREGHRAVIEVIGTIFIEGEVTRPGEYRYVDGMSLSVALALAGGVTSRGSVGHMWIERPTDDGSCVIRAMSATPLLPGDTVRVARIG
jgi:hypothetical protein